MITRQARLDAEEVREALRAEDIISAFGLRPTSTGRVFRLPACPRCGAKSSSSAITIDSRKRTWGHFGNGKAENGECHGDLIDLVAACEGLDTRRDFQRVLERAAEIAGVEARSLTDGERAARRAERERIAAERQREAEREERQMREEAVRRAAFAHGQAMRGRLANGTPTRYHPTGVAWMRRERHLASRPLVDAGIMWHDAWGHVCVPVYSLDTSELINIITRRIYHRDDEPKAVSLRGGSTEGTLCMRIADVTAGSTVIVTEGVTDTLTAIQLWPDAVVLGANGAGRVPLIAEAAAPIIASKGGRLVLVPDGDERGQRAAVQAGEAAMAAGLEMDRTLLVVDLGEHKDLNAAHCAGWKP